MVAAGLISEVSLIAELASVMPGFLVDLLLLLCLTIVLLVFPCGVVAVSRDFFDVSECS